MRVLVLGATTKKERYANIAINMLRDYDHEVLAVGLREGEVRDVKIETDQPDFQNVHTVTLYLGPKNQEPLYDYILGLKPKRVIFNPGTINPEFMKMCDENGIEVVDACTLVMLRSNQFE